MKEYQGNSVKFVLDLYPYEFFFRFLFFTFVPYTNQ